MLIGHHILIQEDHTLDIVFTLVPYLYLEKQRSNLQSLEDRQELSIGHWLQQLIELQWFSYLLNDFHINQSFPISLFCDSQPTLHIAANPVFHKQTKHLDTDCH